MDYIRGGAYLFSFLFLILQMFPSFNPVLPSRVHKPEVFLGNPGDLSLCHRMDAIMQTNVSAELRDSIYPLANYINRSWIVTNGSWRRRRGNETLNEELERARLHDCFFPSCFTLSVVLMPRSLTVLTHTHTQTHTFSILKDFLSSF